MIIYPEEILLYWGFYICNYNYKLKRYYSICKVFKLEKLHHYSIYNVYILIYLIIILGLIIILIL